MPFEYQISINKDEDEKEKVFSVLNDNIGNWMGYNSLEVTTSSLQPSGDLMNQSEAQNKDDFEDYLDANETYDNFEEEKVLIILWRFDHGAGSKIHDLTENENHGRLLKENTLISNEDAGNTWKDGELAPGEPMVFEDEWGKSCPPNWALSFTGQESIRIRSSKTLSKLSGHFTFQAWIFIEEMKEFECNF